MTCEQRTVQDTYFHEISRSLKYLYNICTMHMEETAATPSPCCSEDDKQFKTRSHVMREIVSTEETYVKSLDVLIKLYFVPLEQVCDDSSKVIVTRSRIDSIFSNVRIILGLNQSLLKALRSRLEVWSASAGVGDIFLDFAHFFKVITSPHSQS